ncbi:MAG TPA: energy-coupling factor transporter transmembrane protein EcfT [Spirochaetia bacterium]|nr:energy-coupling factor transporter transmembrane protein EcfT [Spirochaetia bacterium]
MNVPAVFHFRYGDSPLHRADPRAKSAAFVALNAAALLSGTPGLLLSLGMLAAGYIASRESVLRPLRESWLLLLLAATVALTRIAGSGDWGGLSFAARMVLAMLGAHLYSTTTTLREMRNVVRWILQPVAPATAARLSAMMMLTVAFVPTLFDCTGQVADGLAARGLTVRSQPVRYLKFLSAGILTIAVAHAAELSIALECRAYSVDADPPRFPAAEFRWTPATAGCLAAAVALLIVSILT